MSSNSEIKNLEVISKAIDQHNANCEYPAVKVLMNPYEVSRLDWDNIKGLPIEASESIGTGRFHIVCANELDKEESEEVTEVIGIDTNKPHERELVPV